MRGTHISQKPTANPRIPFTGWTYNCYDLTEFFILQFFCE
jgi:hypothetical protein